MKQQIWRWTSVLAVVLAVCGCWAIVSAVCGCWGTVSAADIDLQEKKDDTKLCSLTIHKYDMTEMPTMGMPANGTEYVTIPDGAKVVEGVAYKIYKVEDTYSSKDESGRYMEPDNSPVVTGITGAGGMVTFDNLEQGSYLVVEQASSTLLSLPMKHPGGKGWNYSVHMYPKNAPLLGSVVLEKIEKLREDEGNAEGTVEAALPGAAFILERANTDGVYTKVSEDVYRTDAKGHIVLNNLIAGNYQMSEVNAPQRYGLNSEPARFTIDKAGVSERDGTLREGVQVIATHAGARLPEQIKCTVNTSSTYQGGEVIWSSAPSIPTDIEEYQTYMLTTHFDKRLSYTGLKVELGGGEGTEKTDITNECIVKWSEQPLSEQPLSAQTLSIDLTPCKEQLKGQSVIIEISTTVNEDADGYEGNVSSQTTVNYMNASGDEGAIKGEEISVFVGNVAMPVMKEQEEEIPAWKRWIFRLFPQLQ